MITLRYPSPERVRQFISSQKEQPLTYPETLLAYTRDARQAPGFNNDAQRVRVGQGPEAFQLAKKALQEWVHFPRHWTPVEHLDAPIRTGSVVAVIFRLFGLFWSNSARIVYTEDSATRFGFAYGTLPGHIERGEELFQVEMDEQGVVWYEIRAFSLPRWWPIWFIYPIARLLQAWFRRDSATAVQQFIQSGGTARAREVWRPDQWLIAFFLTPILAFIAFPGQLQHHDYGLSVLVYAVLLFTPAVFHALWRQPFATAHLGTGFRRALFPAALAAAVSLLLPKGWAAAAALPWLALGSFAVFESLKVFRSAALRPIMRLALGSTLVFFGIGTVWLFADRLGIASFIGFDSVFIRLTALHFHFAGLGLMAAATLLLAVFPNAGTRLAALTIAVATPLTAIGITSTRFGGNIFIESICAGLMAAGALLFAAQLLRRSWALRHWEGVLAALTFGYTMGLAGVYALRVLMPELAFNIDEMRAVHGSLNAFVALPLSFWALVRRN